MDTMFAEAAVDGRAGTAHNDPTAATPPATAPAHGHDGPRITFRELRIPNRAVHLVLSHYLDQPGKVMFMLSMVMARVFMVAVQRFAFTMVLIMGVIVSATLLVTIVGLYAKAKLIGLQTLAASGNAIPGWKRRMMEGSANMWRVLNDVMRTIMDISFWMVMEILGGFMHGMVQEGAVLTAVVTPLTLLFAFRALMLTLKPERLPFPPPTTTATPARAHRD